MSWRSAACLAGALALGGCVVQPMYGNFAAGGPGLAGRNFNEDLKNYLLPLFKV